MGRSIVKLADEEYVEWSSVVDAPVTYIMDREQMESHLIKEYGEHSRADMSARFERADKFGSSMRGEGINCVQDAIASNHAGEEGIELRLDEIRKEYKDDQPEERDQEQAMKLYEATCGDIEQQNLYNHTRQGDRIHVTLAAEDRNDALDLLMEMGYFSIKIEELPETTERMILTTFRTYDVAV